MIDFAAPAMLLLALALIPMAMLFWRGARGGRALPGAWHRVIDQRLAPYLAATVAGDRRGSAAALYLAIWALLALALSRPGIPAEVPPSFANAAGRVVVVDMNVTGDDTAAARARTLAARRLIESGGPIPTAVVAVAGDAYDIVPLTTDREHLERYLGVLAPDIMPDEGRALTLAFGHAEGVLDRAGVVARQTVLVTGGTPPPSPDGAAGPLGQRAVLVVDGPAAAWRGWAAEVGADLHGADGRAVIVAALAREVERLQRGQPELAWVDLSSVVAAIAMVLWLFLLRREAA